jgi:hypothetical protein
MRQDLLRDPELTWAELVEIATGLCGELGEARAEINRLRATLRISLAALAPDVPAD